MSSTYEIHDWNETIDSSNRLRPLFTFTPDPEFITYIHENPGPILINLSGTVYYDGQRFGTCISSADFPTFGPNYFQATNNYVMIVHTDFTLLPKQAGKMTIDYGVRTPTLGPCSYQTLTLESFDEDLPKHYYDNIKVGEEQPDDNRVLGNTVSLILIGVIALILLIITTSLIYKRYVV